METAGVENSEPENGSNKVPVGIKDLDIVSNWKVINEKLLRSTISTVDIVGDSERANLEDVVCLETCVRLEADANAKREPCSIDIKLKNGQKIIRLAIVSEAFLIEIYKQFGEYVSTAHAEFIDEFEQSAVYFTDICVPPTSEISIKFARLKNPGMAMWLYGIRLSLTQPVASKASEQFDYGAIAGLLQSKVGASQPVDWAKKMLEKSDAPGGYSGPLMSSFVREFSCISMDSSKHVHLPRKEEAKAEPEKECSEVIGDTKDAKDDTGLKNYIDERLKEMETRLSQRIDTISYKTNEKLDDIIRLLRYKRS